ncbi:hypothetical protein O6H91_17G038700 [Diphasiastrum complanatum]|uniref:Uncharacterized protein n=1 Tax=Diphasiastrum complanatum TaxID=34168 RepID=A0ACC2B5T8_DIPCM|nr:hypothetical protein O6H91_17G038700 [Diphasiastrum complanatum]
MIHMLSNENRNKKNKIENVYKFITYQNVDNKLYINLSFEFEKMCLLYSVDFVQELIAFEKSNESRSLLPSMGIHIMAYTKSILFFFQSLIRLSLLKRLSEAAELVHCTSVMHINVYNPLHFSCNY